MTLLQVFTLLWSSETADYLDSCLRLLHNLFTSSWEKKTGQFQLRFLLYATYKVHYYKVGQLHLCDLLTSKYPPLLAVCQVNTLLNQNFIKKLLWKGHILFMVKSLVTITKTVFGLTSIYRHNRHYVTYSVCNIINKPFEVTGPTVYHFFLSVDGLKSRVSSFTAFHSLGKWRNS